jgi:drug/metabolite transporter (DMT)-like permease
MDISKAIALVKTEPLLSLALVATVLHEHIAWYQWIGVVVMMTGVYVTLLRRSVPHDQTRYRN